jgi:uncharacterized protein YfkK (UPF0435 family)
MTYSVREGFAVVNDGTLEVEEYHDTQEEAMVHLNKLVAAEADPNSVEAAEIAEMRKRKKKVKPKAPTTPTARPKSGQYDEPTFVAVDPGEFTGVAFVQQQPPDSYMFIPMNCD